MGNEEIFAMILSFAGQILQMVLSHFETHPLYVGFLMCNLALVDGAPTNCLLDDTDPLEALDLSGVEDKLLAAWDSEAEHTRPTHAPFSAHGLLLLELLLHWVACHFPLLCLNARMMPDQWNSRWGLWKWLSSYRIASRWTTT